MPDLVSEGSEFSCNFCTSKLKLSVITSSSTGNSQKIANQTNCFLPPPGGNCTFPPGVPPPPCAGVPPGMVVETGQTLVKVDGVTALGDGCQFMCPLFAQPVTLSKAGQEVAKHDEASADVGAYVAGGVLVVAGVALVIYLLPAELVSAAVAGTAAVARAVIKVGPKKLKDIAKNSKQAAKAKPMNPKTKQPKGTRTKNRLPEGKGDDLGPKNGTLERRNPETGELQQKRWYDDKGKPKKDIDYGHDHNGSGDPHVHDWEYKNPQSPNPSRNDGRPLKPGEEI